MRISGKSDDCALHVESQRRNFFALYLNLLSSVLKPYVSVSFFIVSLKIQKVVWLVFKAYNIKSCGQNKLKRFYTQQ